MKDIKTNNVSVGQVSGSLDKFQDLLLVLFEALLLISLELSIVGFQVLVFEFHSNNVSSPEISVFQALVTVSQLIVAAFAVVHNIVIKDKSKNTLLIFPII